MHQAKEIPAQFGRYRILKKLGEGGMGVVYLAEDVQLKRRVALKVPHLDAAADPTTIERFFREARAAAQIDHPLICPIFDIGEYQGFHFLTMPYVEGQPLSQLVGPGRPMATRDAASLVRRLAQALGAIHQLGIIHRDLKPGNILMRPNGVPVIMDFGLARFLVGATTLTQSGAAVGTPAYMSPQQCRNERDLGPDTDIYSLGVILYQLITGQPPFTGPVHAVIGQILYGRLDPPSTVRTRIDGRMDVICLKAMAREVPDRYASMAELARALDDYLAGGGESATPTVTCPGCGKVLKVPADKLGKKLKCPQCKSPIPSPASESPATIDLSTAKTPMPVPGQRPRRLHQRGWSPSVLAGFFLLLSLAVVLFLLWVGLREGGPKKPDKDGPQWNGLKLGPYTNSLGMKFVPVPRGTFWMSQKGRNAQRQVEIPHPFYLGVYEVTQEQWQEVMDDFNPSWHSRAGGLKGAVLNVPDTDLSQFPVEGVSWDDVQAFLKVLNNRAKDGPWLYRLPREEEWEYACRGAATSQNECLFDFYLDRPTNSLFPAQANFAGLQPPGSPFQDSYLQRPAKVGSYDPNWLGLYDMHGNVWEWCLDAAEGGSGQHVLRGGGWSSRAESCRAASRDTAARSDRKGYLGFRVARVPN